MQLSLVNNYSPLVQLSAFMATKHQIDWKMFKSNILKMLESQNSLINVKYILPLDIFFCKLHHLKQSD